MIKIKKIIMHNFKSYRGTHTIDNIDTHLNAIVGPNGCGKSNIIDAVLFLFGFRAKKLRHKTATDLIYKPVNNNDAPALCFVDIIFGIGMKDVSMKRILHRSKKSVYQLDGKDVDQQEIRRFLKSHGLDQNRFLILQGEIETIAMLPPKGLAIKSYCVSKNKEGCTKNKAPDGVIDNEIPRIEKINAKNTTSQGLLEYIEDVIGSNRHKEEIDLLEAELNVLNEEDESKKSVMNFIKKDFLFIKEKFDLNKKNLVEQIGFRKNQIEFKMIVNEMKMREASTIKEKITDYQIQISALGDKNAEYLGEIEKMNSILKSMKSEFAPVENEFYEKTRVNEKIKFENKSKNRQIEAIKKKIEKIEDEISNVESQRRMAENEKRAISEEIMQNKDEIRNLHENVDRVKSEVEILMAKDKNKSGVNTKNNRKNLNDNNQLHELNLQLKIKMNELEMLKSKRVDTEAKIASLNHSLHEYDSVMNYKNVENDIFETQKEIARRKYKLSELERAASKMDSCQAILEKLQNIDGVYGRLGDLGTTDPMYEVAISAASKGQLNNIVVNTTSTAEKCIEIIKRHNLPRTTFIILDKMQEINNDLLNNKKYTYLVNLISCAPEFSRCFFFVFGDTILCNSIEEATQTSFGFVRKRTVTCDGKVIEKSGLMVNSSIRGGIKSSKIEKLAIELKTIEESLQKMKKILAQQEKYRTYKSIDDLKNHILNLESELKNIVENETKFEHEIENLTRKLEKSKSESKIEIENPTIRSKRCEIEITLEKIDILEKRNRDLLIRENHFNFEEIGGKQKTKSILENELKKIKLEDLQDINELESKYYNLKNEIQFSENQLFSLKEKVGSDFHMKKELQNSIDDLNENLKIIDESVARNNNEIQKDLCFVRNCEKLIAGSEEYSDGREGNLAVDEEGHSEENDCKEIDGFPKKNKKEKSLSEANFEFQTNPEIYKNLSLDELKDYRESVKKKIKNIGDDLGEVDEKIFEFFKQKREEFDFETKKYDTFRRKLENMKIELSDLKQKRHSEFMSGFRAINEKLKSIYSRITFGGNAELECLDYLDPFSEGIILSIMPPKKSWKPISNLSGGEKTLSSLALVFALHLYKPSPFYFMDEIDAALDFRNVSVIANFIKESDAQFIIVSLRNDMFEVCENLIGVYRHDGDSRIVCLNVGS